MSDVKVCIITGYGINADRELAEAFELSGGVPEPVHVNDLIAEPESLQSYSIIGFPGGFSFGDHLGSGLVFANLIRRNLKTHVEGFLSNGGLIIGICNGFQVLVKNGGIAKSGWRLGLMRFSHSKRFRIIH